LSISARIVARMGGRLSVESEAGKGSTFSFTTVFHLGAAVRDPALPGSPDTGVGVTVAGQHNRLRILLAEDNSVNQALDGRLSRETNRARRAAPHHRPGGDASVLDGSDTPITGIGRFQRFDERAVNGRLGHTGSDCS
jgi:hypothetical protein